ncbi:hypothetical protein WCP94_004358 [Bilophila wadsworthia]
MSRPRRRIAFRPRQGQGFRHRVSARGRRLTETGKPSGTTASRLHTVSAAVPEGRVSFQKRREK